MTALLTLILFSWMLTGAWFALTGRDLLQSVLGLSLLSLGSVGQFFLFQAPDVALTEAALGVAATSFVLLVGVRQFGRDDATGA